MDDLRQLALEMRTLSDIQDFLNDMIERRHRYECNLIASYSPCVPDSCIEKRDRQQAAVDSFMADLRSLIDLGVFPDGEVPESSRFNITEAAIYIMGRAVQGVCYDDYLLQVSESSVPAPQPSPEIASADPEQENVEPLPDATAEAPSDTPKHTAIHANPVCRMIWPPRSPMRFLPLPFLSRQRPPPVAAASEKPDSIILHRLSIS